MASLVQLLKIALEDARDVFVSGDDLPQTFLRRGGDACGNSSDDGGGDSDGTGGAEEQGMRMLDVQADAMRLYADVQSDFVMFIQAFIDRWAGGTDL